MTPDVDAPQEESALPAADNGGAATAIQDRATATAPENLLDENLDETNSEDALRLRGLSITASLQLASLDIAITGGGLIAALYSSQLLQDDDGYDFSMTNRGGPLDTYYLFQQGEVDANGQKIKKDGDDDDDSIANAIRESRERSEQQQQEREEWESALHSYAGVEMTGEEWARLGEALSSNGVLHKWLVDKIKKDGKAKTEAEAESLANKVAMRAKMNSLPPNQWTEEMRALDRQMHDDPAFAAKVNGYVHDSGQHFLDSFEKKAPEDHAAISQAQNASVSAGDDILDTVSSSAATNSASVRERVTALREVDSNLDFPSAPDLTAHHQAAVAATVPLDAEKPAPQLAALTPPLAPSGGAGLDV